MGGFERLADLTLAVEEVRLDRLAQVVATSAFTRCTTVVTLAGAGALGAGEDVTFDAGDHDHPPAPETLQRLRGGHTVASFSALLAELPLWPRPPTHAVSRNYRRWAFESAALDLALRQAGRSLGTVLGRRSRAVRFVASFRLGDPPSIEPLRVRLERYPGLGVKLDPTPTWSDELLAAIAATGAVEVADLKGVPRGTVADQPPDAGLYRRALAALTEVWVEDPAVTAQTAQVLEPHWPRITWDAPIHSADDIRRLPRRPRMVNVKPSRIGTAERLFEVYDYCDSEGIGMYGGGQFELGPGRTQVQRLASLYHPDAPSDVAPGGFNAPVPPPGLPRSPLPLETAAAGLS